MDDFRDETSLLDVLRGFNPWWERKSPIVPEFRRTAFDECRRYLGHPTLARAILLSGPRRVGKTTVLIQIVDDAIKAGREPKSILYASMDHPMLKHVSLRKILSLYHRDIFPEDRSVLLLLDEIQYSPDWQTEVKLLVDLRPQYRILATGSSSSQHRRGLTESGVGRWVTIRIPTLSFYEYVDFVMMLDGKKAPTFPVALRAGDPFGIMLDKPMEISARLRPFRPLFQRYLLTGGFPERSGLEDLSLFQRLIRDDIVGLVLKKDIPSLFSMRKPSDLEKLFVYLCMHSGGILEHNTCARELGISTPTVDHYLMFLEHAHLLYRLGPAEIGGKKSLKARNKYYLVDAALRNAVLLHGEEIFSRPEEMGKIVETAVLRHLHAFYYRDHPELAYWRDPATDKEVDMIVRSPKYIIPVEVKYREHAEAEPKGGLLTYCRREGGRVERAYLVTKNDEDFGVVEQSDVPAKIIKVPAHILCYLLGLSERGIGDWSEVMLKD